MSNNTPARLPVIVDLPAWQGVRVSYQEPRPAVPAPEPERVADRKPDIARYRGRTWYDGRHGTSRTKPSGGTTMAFTPVVAELPARANALELLIPDLDAVVAAMDKAKPGQAVVISEPFDKESRARNLGRLVVEKLGERKPSVKARAHVVPVGEGDSKKHTAAVSYKPPEKPKTTPAATGS